MHSNAPTFLLIIFLLTGLQSFSQDYETCSFSGEEAWAGDTAAITAFLISCGRIDTTNYDENGKKTTSKPHHQSITMTLNNGKVLHNDSIYFLTDSMPQFPGGDEALIKFLGKNIRYPSPAREKKIEGKVVVTFIVERDGSISSMKVLRGIGSGCDEESLRALKTMPKWLPGKMKGKEVRVQMNLPVRFRLG